LSELRTIADHLRARARDRPDGSALISPRGTRTYRELDDQSDWCARGLADLGVERGTRVAVLVVPGPELLVLAFALAKLGAVPVLVDPGIGRRHLRRCLAEARPEAFVGTAPADWARLLLGWARETVRVRIAVGSWRVPGSIPFREVLARGSGKAPRPLPTEPDEPAAIVFTSGSTGPPKGVRYTHGMFLAQAELLRSTYDIREGEIDLATFPLFALFDPALRMTTVLPVMDFTRPGRVDPRRIIGPVRELGVTHMFGSPALLDRVGQFGAERGIRLPSLRRVLSAGAPVADRVLDRFSRLLGPEARIHTPYGATEALPVCSISHGERRALGGTAEGRGVCVGRPLPGVFLAVIPISDDAVESWSEDRLLPAGEIGELVVWGPNVSPGYFERPEADRAAKIRSEGVVRHRMGDLGYLDPEGRVWFCGRKSHRVRTARGTLFTVPCEGVFNQHPRVRRSALVGVGPPPERAPVLCVELLEKASSAERARIREELLRLGSKTEMTRPIGTILFHPGFPVDIRHNAKIFREKLAEWAAGRRR
jgi:olefin beta-lactone synthetase